MSIQLSNSQQLAEEIRQFKAELAELKRRLLHDAQALRSRLLTPGANREGEAQPED